MKKILLVPNVISGLNLELVVQQVNFNPIVSVALSATEEVTFVRRQGLPIFLVITKE